MIWTLLMAAATVFPMWTILRRVGVDRRWSLVCLTGVGLVAVLWYIAFGKDVGRESVR